MTGRVVGDPASDCGDPAARALVAAAFAAIRDRYVPDRHQIAAAILDADGRIHLGLHCDAMVGRAAVCAEAGALSAARLATDAPLLAVAAVRYPKPAEHGGVRIVPPCGLCRELLLDHAPVLQAVIADGAKAALAPMAGLLPHKYVGTKWAQNGPTASPTDERGTEMNEPDFRTPALDAMAEQIIPEEHFEFSAATARDRFFKDTRMLDVKQWVHNAFRTNPTSMLDHMLANLALTGTEDLLDLGCGNAFILEHLRPHLADGSVTGLDIAPAVLAAAEQRLRGTATPCTWIEGSADDLSMLGDDAFDRVMANYMIHYVPDLDRCFAEVRRVLRPGGIFQLTTDRVDSMLEMYQVHFAALEAMGAPADLFKATPKGRLSLANGATQLKGHFGDVQTVAWQDQLRFTDPEPFMRFYEVGHNHCCASSEPDPRLSDEFFAELRGRVRAQVQHAIESNGHFAVTKYTGSFLCS